MKTFSQVSFQPAGHKPQNFIQKNKQQLCKQQSKRNIQKQQHQPITPIDYNKCELNGLKKKNAIQEALQEHWNLRNRELMYEEMVS